EAAFADLLQELVRADGRAGALGNRFICRSSQAGDGPVERPLPFRATTQQDFHPPAQIVLVPARRVQIGRPLLGSSERQRRVEDFFFFGKDLGHGSCSRRWERHSMRKSSPNRSRRGTKIVGFFRNAQGAGGSLPPARSSCSQARA